MGPHLTLLLTLTLTLIWWQSDTVVLPEFVPRQGAAYRKERLVIFKGDWVGGRARVTIDEERVL